VKPVGKFCKVPILPTGKFARSDDMQIVVIDCRTSAAVGGEVHCVALLDVQNVVGDRRLTSGKGADEKLWMSAANLNCVSSPILIHRVILDAAKRPAPDPDPV